MGRLLFCCRDLKRLKKSFIGCKGNIVYNERRENKRLRQQTFVFLKSLTKVPPASAGSGARQHGNLSIRAQLKK